MQKSGDFDAPAMMMAEFLLKHALSTDFAAFPCKTRYPHRKLRVVLEIPGLHARGREISRFLHLVTAIYDFR